MSRERDAFKLVRIGASLDEQQGKHWRPGFGIPSMLNIFNIFTAPNALNAFDSNSLSASNFKWIQMACRL